VKRQKKGYYILINIRVKASTISELERSLKLTDPVIKFLIIRLDKEPALNNPVMHEVQEHAGEEQRIAEGHRSMTDREGK
jgi:ribosomal protein S6